MTSGTVKKIEEVTVSCRYCSAQKLIAGHRDEHERAQRVPAPVARFDQRCAAQREKQRRAITACMVKRSHTTMITGMPPTSHFALPSSSVKKR